MKKEKKIVNISCSQNAPIYIRVKCASNIIEQYGDFLRVMIYMKIKDKSQADDIMQDFFLSLVEHPIREEIEDIKGYLYTAITNDIIDRIRRIRNYQKKVQRYRETAKKEKQDIPHEKILLTREEIAKLFRKIDKCIPQQEATAILNYFKLKNNASAAAEKMQVDTRTISRYVSVGLKKFRHLLQLADNESI